MKSTFHGYYSPTPDDFQQLWREATFVLDTNVLLDLYRLPATARDEFLAALEQVQDRLWIPHQVALEFQRNRIKVIHEGRRNVEVALTETGKKIFDIQNGIEKLELEKRDLGIDAATLLRELNEASEEISKAITKAVNAQLDISSDDPIRAKLDQLFAGRIGVAPANQDELDALYAEGKQRYENKIPPGFGDVDKAKNPNEAAFHFDDLRYERQYGDLILWRQLLTKAKDLPGLLFITSDSKEDWWWREHNKTIGPHHALIREIHRAAPDCCYWQYTSGAFLHHAERYLNANVSKESVAEIEQVSAAGHANSNVEVAAATTSAPVSPVVMTPTWHTAHTRSMEEKAVTAVHQYHSQWKEITAHRCGPQELLVTQGDSTWIAQVIVAADISDLARQIQLLPSTLLGSNPHFGNHSRTLFGVLTGAPNPYDAASWRAHLSNLIHGTSVVMALVGRILGEQFTEELRAMRSSIPTPPVN